MQSILNTRDLTGTTRFIPAKQAGGQPLDAVILLTALLYQGEHFSPDLQREVKSLADNAVRTKNTQDLETFYLDILSLGKRFDWVQLCELLKSANNTGTVQQFAHLARVAPENLSIIYTAALESRSSDRVAAYLIQYGKAGIDSLIEALRAGQGALTVLLERQVPVSPNTPAFDVAATFTLLHPMLALVAKYLCFFCGAWLVFRGLDRLLFAADEASLVLPRLKSGVIAVLISLVLVAITEPFLLKAAPPSEYQMRFVIPVLADVSSSPPATPSSPNTSMPTSTILSVVVFLLLQILMYVVCLMKIKDINRRAIPPMLKLKLMENEENLFDGGLYIGIAGTATALVLQVLGIIPANLLAAYASNLFGIICVALVKIRHVRPVKYQLILEGQTVPAMVS